LGAEYAADTNTVKYDILPRLSIMGDTREHASLYLRILAPIQRCNTISFSGSLYPLHCPQTMTVVVTVFMGFILLCCILIIFWERWIKLYIRRDFYICT